MARDSLAYPVFLPYGKRMPWNDTFLELFDRCVTVYRGGNRDFESCYYTPADRAFLAEIGYQTREFFDFVEDFCDEGIPSATTAMLIAALPRILAKARAKLRGELDPDLMFGCGGDRRFLEKHGDIHPADFLRRVWAAGNDDGKLATWVAAQGARGGVHEAGT
ncbi:MAG: DUF5069 domain-containing protein [Verrucomicrobia bacterium]|nr:DUF5069 domain-containing protein [Verrucomicrobiota bacterium]